MARVSPLLHRVVAAIRDKAWTPIPYWSSTGTSGLDQQGQPISGADVAELRYVAFAEQELRVRLLVRRVRPPRAARWPSSPSSVTTRS